MNVFWSNRLDCLEQFLSAFMRDKVALGEPSFSLLEAGEFMFKRKYSKEQVETISAFLKKAGAKWKSQQEKSMWGQSLRLDGETQIDMEHVLKVYQSMANKSAYRETLLNNFLQGCEQTIQTQNQKNKPCTHKTKTIHDQNVLVVYIQRYLEGLDKSILELQVYMGHTYHSVANTPCISLQQLYCILHETNIHPCPENGTKQQVLEKRAQKISFFDEQQFKQKHAEPYQTNPSYITEESQGIKDQEDLQIIDYLNPSLSRQPGRMTQLTQPKENVVARIEYNTDFPPDDKLLSTYVQNQSQWYSQIERRTEENQAQEEKKLLQYFNKEQKNKSLEQRHMENPLNPSVVSKQLDLSYLDHTKEHPPIYNNTQQPPAHPLSTSRMFMNTKQEQYQEGLRPSQNTVGNRSALRFNVDENYFKEEKLSISGGKIKSDQFLDYQVKMPLEYYDVVMKGKDPYDGAWHIRPHHVETLTQDRKSHRDNLLASEYQSYLGGRGEGNKEVQPYDGNIRTKEAIIEELERQLDKARQEVEVKKAQSMVRDQALREAGVQKIELVGVEKQQEYYSQVEADQKEELHLKSYQSILLALRQQEKELLQTKRGEQLQIYGRPDQKWYESKGTDFQYNVRKNFYHNVADPEHYGRLADRLEAPGLY